MINEPQIYLASEVTTGVECVIHKLNKNVAFVSLKFSDKNGAKNIPNFTIEDRFILTNEKIQTQLKHIEAQIVKLDGIYTCYDYLFCIDKETVYFLSMSSNKTTLPFKFTMNLNKALNFPLHTPCFSGIYTSAIAYAFIEDIFIQKL